MTSTDRQKKRSLSRFRQGIQFRQAVVCFIAVIILAGIGVFAYLATCSGDSYCGMKLGNFCYCTMD
jgi:hypothetical protein